MRITVLESWDAMLLVSNQSSRYPLMTLILLSLLFVAATLLFLSGRNYASNAFKSLMPSLWKLSAIASVVLFTMGMIWDLKGTDLKPTTNAAVAAVPTPAMPAIPAPPNTPELVGEESDVQPYVEPELSDADKARLRKVFSHPDVWKEDSERRFTAVDLYDYIRMLDKEIAANPKNQKAIKARQRVRHDSGF